MPGAAGVSQALVLFDGVCVLCSWWVAFCLPRDSEKRLVFATIDSHAGRAIANAVGIDPDHPESVIVVHDGESYVKSDAALKVLSMLPGWRWTRIVRVIPRLIRDGVYGLIARNRYALFGKRDTCQLPTPDIADRFL
jgi:predicted DCC family thiol-disulfide oxidoreductase YuxK